MLCDLVGVGVNVVAAPVIPSLVPAFGKEPYVSWIRDFCRNHQVRDLRYVWDDVSEVDGMLVVDGRRIIVPKQVRRNLLDVLHVPHLGAEMTMRNAEELFFWPGMREDIIKLVNQPSLPKEPFVSSDAAIPMEHVDVNLFEAAVVHWLAMVDRFSSFIFLQWLRHLATYMLKALDVFWHEDCLKCGCCDCRLGEVGSTLFTKGNLILCKRDYLRLFGTTGYCSACSKVIPAFEMVMRARTNVYHLECFACQQCNHRYF
eukprot:maker-scaffold921_size81085-snap-gene-0.13 protein:Tk12181 transcript:maker-scaffold921_size81085-snap-gene-0.13-mRNA-1 annotation:"lim domain only protein 3-like isoform x1"